MFPSVSFRQRCKQSHGVHPYRTLDEALKRLYAAGGRGEAAETTCSLHTSRLEPVRGPNLIARVWNLPRTVARQREGAGIPAWSFQEPPRRPREQDKQPFCSAPQRNIAEPMCRDSDGEGPEPLLIT